MIQKIQKSRYVNHVGPYFANFRLDDITPEVVEDFRQKQEVRKKTIKHFTHQKQ